MYRLYVVFVFFRQDYIGYKNPECLSDIRGDNSLHLLSNPCAITKLCFS